MAKTRGTTTNNPPLLSTNKKMVVDGLTKLLTATNFEVFVTMTGVEDKKTLLALIKRKKNRKKIL